MIDKVAGMRILLPLILLLSACATFPELDGTISDAARQAPYPTLTAIPTQRASGRNQDAAMQARIDALQARAARIRQIDMATLQ